LRNWHLLVGGKSGNHEGLIVGGEVARVSEDIGVDEDVGVVVSGSVKEGGDEVGEGLMSLHVEVLPPSL
jgi:hypothetical protein